MAVGLEVLASGIAKASASLVSPLVSQAAMLAPLISVQNRNAVHDAIPPVEE
jgi:hypothetical protein